MEQTGGKIIKKSFKIGIYALVGIILIPLLIAISLLIPPIQTKVAQKVAEKLSEQYGTEISVGSVWFIPMSRIKVNDLLIKDQQNDTLVSIQTLSASINLLALRYEHIDLHYVIAHSPKANLKQLAEGYNFSFLTKLDSITKRDSSAWRINTTELEIKNGSFSLELTDTAKTTTGFNPSHLKFDDINVVARNINVLNDSIQASLNKLSFKEQSGLTVKKGKINIITGKHGLSATKLRFETQESIIRIDSCSITYPHNGDSAKWNYHTKFYVNLLPSIITPNDISLFTRLDTLNLTPFTISGIFSGSPDNIKGKNAEISFGEHTLLQTSFDVMGLPNINETFLFIDITQLKTHVSDINAILKGLPQIKANKLPDWADNISRITYKGNFTGFLNDLVAYGSFNTNLGIINTDLGVKILNDRFHYSGSLHTIGFNLGKMFNLSNQIGKITMKMTVDGSQESKENYFAYLQGTIDSISVRNYNYQNIELNGLLANQKFDGQVNMNDPNGQLTFSGNVDYSKETANFNFFARLREVNLEKLNLTSNFKDTKVSFDLISNVDASSMDDMIGFARLNNGLIERPDKTIKIDSIVVSANRSDEKKQLLINSDLLDARITGRYNFIEIGDAIMKVMTNYIPAAQNPQTALKTTQVNNFIFNVEIKKIGQLLNFIDPQIELSETGSINGTFNKAKNQLSIDSDIPRVKYHNIEGDKLQISVNTNGKLNATVSMGNLKLYNLINLHNFTTYQSAAKNQLISSVNWNNRAQTLNEGNLNATTLFSRNDSSLISTIGIEKSRIILNDSLWNIEPSTIAIAPQDYTIDDFRVWHFNQQIAVDGTVNKSGEDGLSGYLRNITLSDIFTNLDIDYLKLAGILNGEFKASNLLTTPSVEGELTIDELIFNNTPMGNLSLSSNWSKEDNALIIDTRLERNNKEQVNGGGFYSPEKNLISYEAIVDRLDVSFVGEYVDAVMQDFKGEASGIVKLNGTLASPILTARVNMDKGSFNVDYLKTSYTIQDSAFLEPNRIVFQNMTLMDRHKHKGVFNGYIQHNQFGDLYFNLDVIVKNLLSLDTKEKDNTMYYGTAYTTGSLKIEGTTDLINLNIKAKSMPNTQLFIPITSASEVSSSDFIQFVSAAKNQTPQNNEATKQTDLSGIEMTMDLEITPDAKAQIIFDARSGDILKGVGNGDIQLKIDQRNNLRIDGDYVFEEGDYMFSLQNLINKKFIISKGSSLRWDGDPYNAIINLKADYKLRANLYDLVGATMSDESTVAELKKRVPVTCNLILSDRLRKPNIQLGIETPSLDQSSQNFIKEYIPSEEEMNRQVLSLLVLNRFYSASQQQSTNQAQSEGGNNAALTTTTEVLSNQLNKWLSQITSDVNVGVSYRPGDEITTQEVEVALSTQLFNDRLQVNGNVGYSEYTYETDANSLIGDFDATFKLNKSGSVRAHAYTRTNNDILYTTTSPNKQGVGVSFRQEFDNWLDLMKKYWGMLKGKKENNDK